MKRDWLRKQLGDDVSDDVIDAIMAQNGSDVNTAKLPSENLRTQVDELKARNAELEGVANANLTEQEKWTKKLEVANKAAAEATKQLNEMCAVAEFSKAGLTEEEYKPFLASVVSDSRESTVAAASAISSLINAKAAAAVADANKAAMANMQAPAGGNESDGAVSTKADFDKLSPEKKVEWVHANPGALSQLK